MNVVQELVDKYKSKDLETFYEDMVEMRGAIKAIGNKARTPYEKDTVDVTLAFIELAITMTKDLMKCKQSEKEEQWKN